MERSLARAATLAKDGEAPVAKSQTGSAHSAYFDMQLFLDLRHDKGPKEVVRKRPDKSTS